MLLRPGSFVFWLSIALLLGGCGRQGQGESCNTQGNDCSSGLTCQPIAGYLDLGKCCLPNSQCGGAQTVSIVHQDGDASADVGGLDANGQSIDTEAGRDTGTMDTGAMDTGPQSGADASDGGGGG